MHFPNFSYQRFESNFSLVLASDEPVIYIIVCNIRVRYPKHSFSYVCKQMRMLLKHSCVYFFTLFTLTYLNFLNLKNIYLIINKSAKVWYLPYLEGVLHTRMLRMFTYASERMVRMVHTMYHTIINFG